MRQHFKRTVLKQRAKSVLIFHLSSTQYSVLAKIVLYDDLEKIQTSFLILYYEAVPVANRLETKRLNPYRYLIYLVHSY